MTRSTYAATCTLTLALVAIPIGAAADSATLIQRQCSAQSRGTYGFQCTGYTNVGAGLEPVTFLGTAVSDGTGTFDGLGTFNSSLGSNRMHAVGRVVYQNRTCAGHIQYQQFLVLPDGTEVDIHTPLDIEAVTVDNGFEIFGTAVAIDGSTGAGVPRMACRLVKARN